MGAVWSGAQDEASDDRSRPASCLLEPKSRPAEG
jgi:hypothetical protein